MGCTGWDKLQCRRGRRCIRVLLRHRLVAAFARKRRQEDYRRCERLRSMQLWQREATRAHVSEISVRHEGARGRTTITFRSTFHVSLFFESGHRCERKFANGTCHAAAS